MLTWEPMPKLNSCIIPWYYTTKKMVAPKIYLYHQIYSSYPLSYKTALYNCLKQELLAWNRRNIRNSHGCNRPQTHNQLVSKGTLNHVPKVFVYKLSGCGLSPVAVADNFICSIDFVFVFKRKKAQEKGRSKRKLVYSSNLDLFTNTKKLFWRLSFKNSIQDWVFLPFTGPKKYLE